MLKSFKLYTKRVIDKLSKAPSMLSLHNSKELRTILNLHAWKILSIATNKMKVSTRLRRFNKFLDLILKAYKHHGATYVVKWLKASHVCVQRKLSSNPMSSLRELEKNLPLPRLINGLPTFIGPMDRKAIRMKHPGTIRLWLTILSIYRVLEAPSKPNLETITNPSKSDPSREKILLFEIKDIIIFNKMIRQIDALKASKVHRTLKSGPNNSISYLSVITDALAIYQDKVIFTAFCNYCIQTSSDDFLLFLRKVMAFAIKAQTKFGDSVIRRAKSVKTLADLRTGKLAFKIEPAGKVRTFALVDIWTQSLLAPLHKDLFSLLKKLPNDGTFDQDASFARCIEKAKLYNCAFAYDLSSATDRLPLTIQKGIINLIYNHPFLGNYWGDLLINRKYIVRSELFPDLQNKEFTYATGQPMGCLSSWAMLALTHHLIMQTCAFRVYGSRKWYDKYEVLGDDIVIFDKDVALQYLALMAELDVGINLSKSLQAEELQTLEFAKRTAIDGYDVSGLSWKQLISGNNDQGRTNFALAMIKKGFISSNNMLIKAMSWSRYYSLKDLFKNGESHFRIKIENGLINILGSFAENAKLPLNSVVSLLVDPHKEVRYFADKAKPPVLTMLQLILKVNKEINVSLETLIPQYQKRIESVTFNHMIENLANEIYFDCLDRWSVFLASYEDKMWRIMLEFVTPSEAYLFEIDNELFKDLRWITERTVLGHDDPAFLTYALDAYSFKVQNSTGGPKWVAGEVTFSDESHLNYDLEASTHYAELVDNFISRFDFEPIETNIRSPSELPRIIRSVLKSEEDLIEDQFA